METTPLTRFDRDWAMYAHLAGLLALTNFPFVNIIAVLAVYLKVRNNESAFALSHARAALNFQLTFAIFSFAFFPVLFYCWISMFTLGNVTTPPVALLTTLAITLLAGLAAGVFYVACCILGAIAASNGRPYNYPIAVPFVH